MNQKKLEDSLHGLPLGEIIYYETVGSTNNLVSKLAKQGAPDLTLIFANQQTKGRGRSGRTWFTPPDSAIAFSLLLKPTNSIVNKGLSLISGLGALAVCDSLSNLYNLQAEIKWPNDVLIGGKKVCGVLVETNWAGNDLEAVILGIGINTAAESVPSSTQLNFPATSVEDITQFPIDRLFLLKEIITRVIFWKDKIHNPEFISSWEQHLAFQDTKVQIISKNTVVHKGQIIGLDKLGRLILRKQNNEDVSINVGEIHLRPFIDKEAN